MLGARGSSSAPVPVKREVKKETTGLLPRGRLKLRRPKEEDVHPPPAAAKKWWDMEMEVQAAYHGPNNPADMPGSTCLLVVPSMRDNAR